MTIILHSIDDPIKREERNKINENWNRIVSGLTNLQRQINILTGDVDIDELLAEVTNATNEAKITTTEMLSLIDSVNLKLVEINTALVDVDNASSAVNDLVEEYYLIESELTVIKKDLMQLQLDLVALNNSLVQAESERNTQETVRIESENSRNLAESQRISLESTRESNEATRISAENKRVLDEETRKSNEQTRVDNEISRNNTFDTKVSEVNQAIVDGNSFLSSSVHKREYSPLTQYYKNNEVMFNGSTWRCMQDCISITPIEGVNWTLVAQRGIDGEGSVSSVNGVHPDLNGNVAIDASSLGGVTQEVFAAHANNNNIHITKTEKDKLSGIETGAQVNKVNSVNGQTGDVVVQGFSIGKAPPTNKNIFWIDIN